MAAHSAMLRPSISDERAASFSRVPPQAGQALEGRDPLDGGAEARLERVDVLDEVAAPDLVDEPDVGEVEVVELDLRLLAVEEAAASSASVKSRSGLSGSKKPESA